MLAAPHTAPLPVPTPVPGVTVGASSPFLSAAFGTAMIALPPDHPLRPAAEELIRSVYAQAHGARVARFPRLLMAALDGEGRPACAAGVRTTADGFFSEAYLDHPVERVLAHQAGRHVHRARVFEVTTMVSRRADLSAAFIHALACRGAAQGFDWCFFTATQRLRRLLQRLHPPLLVLAPADPARLADAGSWGRYYQSAPAVCAADDWPQLPLAAGAAPGAEALSRAQALSCGEALSCAQEGAVDA